MTINIRNKRILNDFTVRGGYNVYLVLLPIQDFSSLADIRYRVIYAEFAVIERMVAA